MGTELRATLDHRVDALLRGRLHQLRRASGLPIVLCGTTSRAADGQRLRITGLLGTLGRSLADLEIRPGRGMGGTVVAQARPCRVNDYASSTAITHDFDHMVVSQERIRSIFALPVVVHGAVRGVLYGATRDTQPIGDVALHHAGVIAAAAAKDLATLPSSAPPATTPERTVRHHARHRSERALDELAALARTVTDPALRDQLARIHRDLGGSTSQPTRPPVALAPRELDALRLVEVGASNTAIAEELGLSLQTVKAYLYSAMRKLDVHNRTSAVHAARTLGLL